MTDDDGDPVCGPFLTLPSKKDYPDYYEDIDKPIALDMIRAKVVKGNYLSANNFFDNPAYLNSGYIIYDARCSIFDNN